MNVAITLTMSIIDKITIAHLIAGLADSITLITIKISNRGIIKDTIDIVVGLDKSSGGIRLNIFAIIPL